MTNQMRRFGLNRGKLTKAAKLIWANHGYGELTLVQLRLLPYIDRTCKNFGRVNTDIVSHEELIVLSDWRNKEYIHFVPEIGTISVTRQFYDAMQAVLFQAYVAQVEYASPEELFAKDVNVKPSTLHHINPSSIGGIVYHIPTGVSVPYTGGVGITASIHDAKNKLKQLIIDNKYWKNNYGRIQDE